MLECWFNNQSKQYWSTRPKMLALIWQTMLILPCNLYHVSRMLFGKLKPFCPSWGWFQFCTGCKYLQIFEAAGGRFLGFARVPPTPRLICTHWRNLSREIANNRSNIFKSSSNFKLQSEKEISQSKSRNINFIFPPTVIGFKYLQKDKSKHNCFKLL